VKKILIQLDTDERASNFDAIVAYDSDVDIVIPHGGVKAEEVRELVQDAFFTRGPKDLKNMAVWIGGYNVTVGEELLGEVKKTFFGPFKVSVMLDPNGCNTTAAAAVVRLLSSADVKGQKALVVGVGAVGVRAATLLQREGCEVTVATIPADVFGDDRPYHRPRGLKVAEDLGLNPVEPSDSDELRKLLGEASILLAVGPAGVQLFAQDDWKANSDLRYLVDFNAAEPLGIEGIDAQDDLEERDGKLALGALGIGNRKMKVHKAGLRSLFETNDLILDLDGIYEVAKESGT
jgi:methylenetetrahydrofolate/methylenetetrahydromethanopterin dehydrogenase (NADP+)